MLATAHWSSPLLAAALVAAFWTLRRSNELEDIVSFSSRLIAAARAVESEREDALFVDPFAAVLAGPKALTKCRSRMSKYASQTPSHSTAPRSVGNLTCRTKYLDDAVKFFVGGGGVAARMADYLEQVKVAASAHAGTAPQQQRHAQVVLLGAGMDTRAQRLDLPPGTKWFEVDRAEVLRVKHNLLRSMKHKVLQNMNISVQSAGGELGCTPLRNILESTTFDSANPTLWILEGLTMYLTPDQNSKLLQEMAELSSGGSMFLMSLVPEESIGKQWTPGSLMSTWKWGFSGTFVEDTKALGWEVVDSVDYASIAHLYGCNYSRRMSAVSAAATEIVDSSDPHLKMTPAASMVPDRVQITSAVLCV